MAPHHTKTLNLRNWKMFVHGTIWWFQYCLVEDLIKWIHATCMDNEFGMNLINLNQLGCENKTNLKLERLFSEYTPRRLMITHIIESYWIPSQKKSLHVTHPLMLMMICAKYGKNASRIVDFFKVKAEKLEKLDSTRHKASEICLRPPLHIYFHKFSR